MKKNILKYLIKKALKEEKQPLNEGMKWCGCPTSGGGITAWYTSHSCHTFCPGGYQCTNPGCYKQKPPHSGGGNGETLELIPHERFDDSTGGEDKPEPTKRKPGLKEVKRAIAKMIKEAAVCVTPRDCQSCKSHDDCGGVVQCIHMGGSNPNCKCCATSMPQQRENVELSKDAQILSDHPLLDKINTKDEWVDIMTALMDHGNTISTVSDSIKKTTLMAMVKTIGKEETPQNGEL